MRVAIVHPWEGAKFTEPVQWDGLHKALQIIGQKHQVDWFLAGDVPDDTYNWIIPWGVGSIPFNYTIEKYKARKAFLCAGHPQDTANFEKFEAIFVESPAVAKQILHPKVVLAFGTDTDFFKPEEEEEIFDVFFPATYSPWKRQDLFAEATKGLKALTCGVVQPDGIEIYNKCKEVGGYTMAGLVPSKLIAKLYNMSKVVCITAWHGSERTALEAMASNRPLIITKDNELTCSLAGNGYCIEPNPEKLRYWIEKLMDDTTDMRTHVMQRYTHQHYAQKLLSVIES